MKIPAQCFRKNSRNKYGAKKTIVGNITLDSKKEAHRWMELQLLESAGVISELQRQVKIDLMGQHGPLLTRTGRKMRFTVDFAYTEKGAVIHEDVKGYATRDYEVRVAVARAMGLEVKET
jgi:hypothetical protein